MTAREILALARADFDSRLVQIRDDQWDSPTSDGEWTVRDLVAHVVAGNRMGALLIQGGSAAEASAVINNPALGDDPIADFRQSADERDAAFANDDVLERTCHHPMLDLSGAQLLGLGTGELGLHAWDLARALDVDDTLNDDVVAALWDTFSPLEPFIGTLGVYGEGPSGRVSADAPLQTRLLDLVGRRP